MPLSAREKPVPATNSSLRYTFTAQRAWPGVCADVKTIATNSANGLLNANALSPGKYTSFSVHVTSPQGLPSVIGDASASLQFEVKPTAGFDVNTKWDVYPPAGSPGPAQVSFTHTVLFPPEETTFLFRIVCGLICQPGDGATPLPQTSPSISYTFSAMMKPVALRQLWAHIEQIHLGNQYAPDCTWVASFDAYKFDYYLKP
jgi:hypothetical protein